MTGRARWFGAWTFAAHAGTLPGFVATLSRRGRSVLGRAGGPAPLFGVALLVLGAAVPWIGVPLETQRRAVSLPVNFGGFGRVQWVSYGLVELLLLAAVVAALVRGRGRPTALVGACALGAVITAICFYAGTSVVDVPLLEHLAHQTSELTAITGQLGYKVPRTQPTTLLFVPLSGPWRTLAGQVRPGWFAVMLGGSVLLLWSARELLQAMRRSRVVTRTVLAALAGVLFLALFGRAIVGNVLADQALVDVQAGQYNDALGEFQSMDTWDRDMRLRSGVEASWGTALLVAGSRQAPDALLADSREQDAIGNTANSLAELDQAARLAPDDPIITEAQIAGLRRAAVRGADPTPLQEAIQRPSGNAAAEQYTLGRVLYKGGQYRSAAEHFTVVLGQTVEPNVRSSALTYRALCELRLGDSLASRADLLEAVATDTEYNNSLARSISSGLYQSAAD